MERPTPELPVIYLSFSNSQDAYLALLDEEASALSKILQPMAEAKNYEVFQEKGVDLNDLFDSFRRYRNRISVFHYGGHADSDHLILEGESVNSGGLATLFALEENLKLIFLNGCSTKKQVELLLEKNIPAVIATSVPVDDHAAVEFSKQFYRELVSGSTLKSAFEVASAYVMAKYDKKSRPAVVYRDINWDNAFSETEEIPWGLYVGPRHQDILNWRLVDEGMSKNIDFESLSTATFSTESMDMVGETYQVNQYLERFILESVEQWDEQIVAGVSSQENIEMIMYSNIFPWPIQLELNKLLNITNNMSLINFDRLRQLIFTYQEMTRFLAFTYLAQLIQVVEEQQCHLSTSNVLLTRFFGLNRNQGWTFDHIELANDVDQIFRDHEIKPWLKEQINVLKAFDEEEELENIHAFMKKMFPFILDENIGNVPSELDLLCQQAEYCLAKLLKQFTFYIRYDLIGLKPREQEYPSVSKAEEEPALEQYFEGSIESQSTELHQPTAFDYTIYRIPSGGTITTTFPEGSVSGQSIRLTRNNEGLSFDSIDDDIINGLDLSIFFKDTISPETDHELWVYAFREFDGVEEYLSFRVTLNSNNVHFVLTNDRYVYPNEELYFDFNQILAIDAIKQSPKRFRYANYNSDSADGEDHLDIMPDVRAFANLIASQDLRPPLSIGLFGDWGSGKSFFMGKLKKEVAEYERMAKRELAKSADEFMESLAKTIDKKEREQKILSLFPSPKTQVDQIKEWLKKWERKRDPSALQSLGGVFSRSPNEIEKMLKDGQLKSYTKDEVLIKGITSGQQKKAIQLVNDFSSNRKGVDTLLRKLAELNAEPQLGYCRNIAQIEFNAWHYIDTNLWASLVTNILNDLNIYVGNLPAEEEKQIKLYRDLATTHQLKAEVVLEIKKLEDDINLVEKNISELRQSKETAEKELEDISTEVVIKELIKGDQNVGTIIRHIRSLGREASDKLGLSNLMDDVEKTEKEIQKIEEETKNLRKKGMTWWKYFWDLKFRVQIIFVTLLVVPILAFWILPSVIDANIHPFVNWLQTGISPFSKMMVAACAFGTDGFLLFQKVREKINKAVDALDLAKSRLQKLQKQASEKYREQIQQQQKELTEKQTQLKEAEKRKAAYDAQKEDLKKDLDDINEGKRLSAFIERRFLSNDYQQHLGLISLIREDFERLTSYLHDRGFYTKIIHQLQELLPGEITIHKDGNDEKLDDLYQLEKINTIDRIVLYIDDLDRCPPEKVVQVLQAIHLILAFPLFVVVVGVDVRWVSLSLAKEYGSMLSGSSAAARQASGMEDQANDGLQIEFNNGATPYDYIEKIFQIPFQLRNMSNDSKSFFIGKLLEEDMKQAKAANFTPQETAKTNQLLDNLLPTKSEEPTVEKQAKKGAPKKTAQKATPPEQTIESTKPITIAKSPRILHETKRLEKVSLKVREINFIKAMSPILAGSPRTVKRFVNVCRLIKSHAVWGKPQRVLQGILTDYETMILILGLVTGIPLFTRFLYDQLEQEDQNKTFQELIEEVALKMNQLENKTMVSPPNAASSTNSNSSIINNTNFNEEVLLEEWTSFQKIWGLRENNHNLIPLEDSENRQLVEDFCSKKLASIRPLFKTAIRFSFRFTEY